MRQRGENFFFKRSVVASLALFAEGGGCRQEIIRRMRSLTLPKIPRLLAPGVLDRVGSGGITPPPLPRHCLLEQWDLHPPMACVQRRSRGSTKTASARSHQGPDRDNRGIAGHHRGAGGSIKTVTLHLFLRSVGKGDTKPPHSLSLAVEKGYLTKGQAEASR